jgi:hypothetical protein
MTKRLNNGQEITNDDIWASVRGLAMFKMSVEELDDLIDHHIHSDLFASRVIVHAAYQVSAAKRAMKKEG